MALILRAGIHFQRNHRERCLQDLVAAAAKFDNEQMALFAAAARRRRGELIGGDEGRALIEAADALLVSEGVKRPEKFLAMMAPGFTR